jgi:HSP20 family protein
METTPLDPLAELRPLLARELDEAPWEERVGQTTQPLCFDAYRIGDDLHIDFDIPGVDPSTIELSVENHVLTVSVVRELPCQGVEVIERGRIHGKFKRSLLLPTHWDVDRLSAVVENGVLGIQAPWSPSTTKRSIGIAVHANPSNIHTAGGDVEANDARSAGGDRSPTWSAA